MKVLFFKFSYQRGSIFLVPSISWLSHPPQSTWSLLPKAPHRMEAVRGLCSRESITQPTWLSKGGLELCLVFLFRGICKGQSRTRYLLYSYNCEEQQAFCRFKIPSYVCAVSQFTNHFHIYYLIMSTARRWYAYFTEEEVEAWERSDLPKDLHLVSLP